MAHVALQLGTPLDKALSPFANRFYSWIGIKPEQEQRWQTYAFSALCKPGVGFVQSLNTAISFATNTNWQSYTPESTLENFVQMVGLSVQMFLSSVTALAVALAVTRAFTDYKPSINNNAVKANGTNSNSVSTIGNFWVNCTRMILWVLVPLSFLLALIFRDLLFASGSEYNPHISVQGAMR
jgi:K+-transporting ATPase ATPase A chain